jgi:hypothetical protein
VFLQEAAMRLEAAASLLSAAALGHIAPGDLAQAVTPLIGVLDDAARYVAQAGEE